MSRKSQVPIELPADPTNALEAATKQYVDNKKLNSFGVDGTLNMNGFAIGNMLEPILGTSAANKNYVDGVALALDVKRSVRATSTANLGTYTAGASQGLGTMTAMPNTIDGVTLAAADRVLLKDQTNQKSNGIWEIDTLGTGANGAWSRTPDFASTAPGFLVETLTTAAHTFVEEGTQADTQWLLTTNAPFEVDGPSGSNLVWRLTSNLTVQDENVTQVTGTNVLDFQGAGVTVTPGATGEAVVTVSGSVGGPPSGTAGGDLSGTYPNPTIGTGKVTSAHIATGTIAADDIGYDVIHVDHMSATGTPSATTHLRGDNTWAPTAQSGKTTVGVTSVQTATGSVVFPVAYPVAPIVVAYAAQRRWVVNAVGDPITSGFDYRVQHVNDSTTHGDTTVTVYWIAQP